MNQIRRKRHLIGTGADMAVYVAKILERPGGKRDLARRALATGFKKDPLTYSNICNDGELYRKELLELSNILDLHISNGCPTADIIGYIKRYADEAYACMQNVPKLVSLDVAIRAYTKTKFGYNSGLSASYKNSFLLSKNGKVICCGNYQRDIPHSNERFIAISASITHTLALTEDGNIIGCSNSRVYNCGTPTKKNVSRYFRSLDFTKSDRASCGYKFESIEEVKFIAISTGNRHSLALTIDGSVVSWGRNGCGAPKFNKSCKRFIAISAGDWHSLALGEDGRILVGGDNRYGQCNVPSTKYKRFIAISAGGHHSLALAEDGTILAWGRNDWGQCNVPESDKRFIAISAGGSHSLALAEDGTTLAWGLNNHGQCDVPNSDKRFVAISAGEWHSLALSEGGRIVAWGNNEDGQCNISDHVL